MAGFSNIQASIQASENPDTVEIAKNFPQSAEEALSSFKNRLDKQEKDIKESAEILKEATRELNKAKGDIQDTKNIAFYGFLILLVMVAAIVIDAVVSKTAQEHELIKSIDQLQFQLQSQVNHTYLPTNATTTPKR